MFSEVLSVLSPFIPFIIGAVVVLVLLLMTIKVVSGNEVLVVTGIGATKKIVKKVKVIKDGEETEDELVTYIPKIRVAGAAFVIPFIQSSRRFDICVRKALKMNDTMKTKTGVEIVTDWGISYAPNADSIDALAVCIRQFLDKDDHDIEDIIMSSVAGGMRAVISTMTPIDVMISKDTLDDAVQKNIATQMADLGFKVQIYIQEVRDAQDSTYYRDLAARDREETRREAEQITAKANQEIRQKKAEAERLAKESELAAEVAVAQSERNTAVQKAQFKVETDKANANAELAGQIQAQECQRELTEKQGAVEVMKQQQAEQAALAEQAVEKTKAETEKAKNIIAALAKSEQDKIAAEAKAKIAETEAEGQAKAERAKAQGASDAAKKRAEGEAAAKKMDADAEAERIKKIGAADAEAIRLKGEANAAAILAKGKAEADAARVLSDAQAANDRVNFEITKLEIQRDTQIQVATNIANVMAKIGENATFYDFGGNITGDGSDLLTRIMGNIPQLFAKINLQNVALNGQPLPNTVQELASAILSPLGNALHGTKPSAVEETEESAIQEEATGGEEAEILTPAEVLNNDPDEEVADPSVEPKDEDGDRQDWINKDESGEEDGHDDGDVDDVE